MSDETLPEEIEKWSLLVGRLISAFNEIELSTVKLWEIYFPKKKSPHKFTQRARDIIKEIKNDSLIDDIAGVAIKNLEDAIVLARKRNTVAHNPVQVQVWEHRATEEYHIEFAVTTPDDKDYVKESDFEPLTKQASKLGSELLGFVQERWKRNV
jgi:hypothetical protein